MTDITFNVKSTNITFPPPSVGCWVIGGEWGLHIYLTKKPRWLTRVLMRWLVEWEWKDNK